MEKCKALKGEKITFQCRDRPIWKVESGVFKGKLKRSVFCVIDKPMRKV